jgi:cobalt-zinc-cadmium efflux system outer membrane protein
MATLPGLHQVQQKSPDREAAMITTENKFHRMPALASLLIGLLALTGCASVQRDARLPEVQDTVADRLGQRVEWNRDSEQDKRARDAMRELLSPELTPGSAVQIALLNNRRLQAKFADLGVAQADLVEAGLLENPVFGASALFQDAGTELEMDVVQNFLSVFTLSAREKIGRATAERATLEVSNDVLDLAAQVQSQYFRVVGGAEALGLARQVVIATEAAAEIAQRQYAAGNLSKREQSLQQAFYAQTLLEVAQAEMQLDADREKLNRLMGVWGADTNWRIPSRLPQIPQTLPSMEAIEGTAIARRLDLAAAKKDAEGLAEAAYLAHQFRWLSPLGIGVKFKRDSDGEKSYGPSIELGLPIFNQGQTQIARLESERDRAEDLVAALAVEIRSEARENRTRLGALHRSAKHYEQSLLPLQQTIVTETLKFYNGMLLGVYDLLLASQSQIHAARQYIATNRDFWLAWTELERAVGGRIAIPAESPQSGADTPANNAHQHGDPQS